jgi:hypothetical protein
MAEAGRNRRRTRDEVYCRLVELVSMGDGDLEAYCGRQQLRRGRGRLAARQTCWGLDRSVVSSKRAALGFFITCCSPPQSFFPQIWTLLFQLLAPVPIRCCASKFKDVREDSSDPFHALNLCFWQDSRSISFVVVIACKFFNTTSILCRGRNALSTRTRQRISRSSQLAPVRALFGGNKEASYRSLSVMICLFCVAPKSSRSKTMPNLLTIAAGRWQSTRQYGGAHGKYEEGTTGKVELLFEFLSVISFVWTALFRLAWSDVKEQI